MNVIDFHGHGLVYEFANRCGKRPVQASRKWVAHVNEQNKATLTTIAATCCCFIFERNLQHQENDSNKG
jgi:hypothetical protein